jgi:uncharacterized membrane protein YsdA (DUF1294 family)
MGALLLASVASFVGVALLERRRRRKARARRAEQRPRVGAGIRITTTVIGLVAAGVLTQAWMTRFEWPAGLAWLAAINVVALASFGVDKVAAVLGVLRIPESTLHTLALFGGSPAIIVGQDLLNHKVSERKRRFQYILTAIVLVQIGVLLMYLRTLPPAA